MVVWENILSRLYHLKNKGVRVLDRNGCTSLSESSSLQIKLSDKKLPVHGSPIRMKNLNSYWFSI